MRRHKYVWVIERNYNGVWLPYYVSSSVEAYLNRKEALEYVKFYNGDLDKNYRATKYTPQVKP